ncbi:patatin-like phospholipase family protein [Lentisphaerota bacterium ZTH]|nr:patatin-like phospholipase family protein [Lentisphaerota bacterium]WET06010.1 patatin-like phospholipase family protein [Lentisphaerota bacterium ZTH]
MNFDEFKYMCIEDLNNYIKNPLVSKLLAHHHNKRAKHIRNIVASCSNPQQITRIVDNELSLMRHNRSNYYDHAFHLDDSSFSQEYAKSHCSNRVKNTRTNLINSSYYRILLQIKSRCEYFNRPFTLGNKKMLSIENIVFSGGGAKGAAYPGVYKALKEKGVFDNISEIAGTSAGAITAALCATGISYERFIEISSNMNFKKLLGERTGLISRSGQPLLELLRRTIKANILDFFADLGIVSADGIAADLDNYREVRSLFRKILSPCYGVTFRDLNLLQTVMPVIFKRLIITALNKTTGQLEVFTQETTPEVDIALACRASAGIPVLLSTTRINGNKYIDGGYVDNHPTEFFRSKDKSQTLVFAFGEGSNSVNPVYQALYSEKRKLYHPGMLEKMKRDWAPSTLSRIAGSHKNTIHKESGYKKLQTDYALRTVEINAGNIKTTDFDLAQRHFAELLEIGYRSTVNYLENHLNESI